MSRYPFRPLGEALESNIDEVDVYASESYAMAGVYGFGRGLFARSPIQGEQTHYAKLRRLHADDLVMSRLKAFEGAIAVVPEEYDGYFLSPEFPTFKVDRKKADVAYLRHVCAWPDFWQRLRVSSKGLGARRERVSPHRLFSIEIPLPDLDEQRRIATKLDIALSYYEEVWRKSQISERCLAYLQGRILAEVYANSSSRMLALGEFSTVTRGKGPRYTQQVSSVALNQGCIRWDGVDLTRVRAVNPEWEETVPESHRAHIDDVMINSTGDGTIGRAALVKSAGVGLPFDSHVLAVRVDESQLRPEFLALMLRTPQVQDFIQANKGASTTKQTELGKRKLEQLRLPVPRSLASQDVTLTRARKLLGQATDVSRKNHHRHELSKAFRPAVLNAAFSGQL